MIGQLCNGDPSLISMGSTESLAGALADEQLKESKVFKSAFAKQLEEKRAPLMREVKEGERRVALTSSAFSEMLVVPQATLGGRLKGSSVQYHGNVKVEDGAKLYDVFCAGLAEKLGEGRLKRGRFGARQILSTVTSGPYSHTFDIS